MLPKKSSKPVILLVVSAMMILLIVENGNCDRVKILSRAKRFLWMTHNRKMVLPKGTILDIAPRLQIPFIRQPPEGLNSDIQVTWHFYMYFDKLGMTSDTHPWPPRYPFSDFFPSGNLPLPRPANEQGTLFKKTSSSSMNQNQNDQYQFDRVSNEVGEDTMSGSPLGKTDINKETETKNGDPDKDRIIIKASQPINEGRGKSSTSRKPRSVLSLPPPDSLPGGERAILIPQLEKMISSMGYDGRACLLRTVCEVHEFPLHKTGFGLLGEIVTLVFSISMSDYADSHLSEYLKAEAAGKAGECSSYFKHCSKSLFMWEEKNKYSEEMQNVVHNKK